MNPSPAQLDRIKRIAGAAQAIHNATRDLARDLRQSGMRFPDGLYITLDYLDFSAAHLTMLLKPSYLTDAEDLPRRDDSQDQRSGAQTPAKD